MSRKNTRPAPPLRSVTAPKQARSAATLQRLLDAAEDLIAEKGLRDVSIPDIVARAGSSVGGFYARFKDKDELLRALEERFLGEMREILDELAAPGRWVDAGIPEIARAGVETLLRVFRERRALMVAFMARAAADESRIEQVMELRREVSARFVTLLNTRAERLDHPRPDVAVDLAVQLVFGLMQQRVVFGEIRVGERILSERDLADELVRNVLAYIGHRDEASLAAASSD